MQPFEPPARERIFISYRHGDNAYAARWLNVVLRERFGADRVFFDTGMDPGVNYVQEIERELDSCAVLLAVIGPQWMVIADELGQRRLENPNDVVVREISTALRNGVRVIPVLIDDAAMPKSAELPTGLRPLTQHNGVVLNPGTSDSELGRLLAALDKHLAGPSAPPDPEPEPEPVVRSRYDLLHDLVQECITPPDGPGRELPVIRLLGSGTEMLAYLAEDCGPSVPHTRLDFDAEGLTSLRRAVVELAVRFGGRDSPQFRHLMLCIVAAGSGFGAGTALSKLRNAVLAAEQPDFFRVTFDAVVGALQASGALLNWSGVLAGALLSGGERAQWRRRLRALTGFRDSAGVAPDPWAEPDAVGSREFDEVLLAAFLADLRQARAGRRSGRAMNCVALLDNADAPLGERFLDLLLDLRRGLPPDPLVVVAAGRQWQPPLDAPEAVDLPTLAGWEEHRSVAGNRGSGWLPVDL
ncbi:toll/interleukin-1 receptor domain-containing protein [Saccharopolyspora sp. NPDC050642]|uniref:toll/interleukin-1 receptor domain-containing protein n=1 Tax=Saccharopolyspora sp. NPDC050642 TaxID=3157099 RepID=UPI003407C19A